MRNMISGLITRAFETDFLELTLFWYRAHSFEADLFRCRNLSDESSIALKRTLFYASRIHDVKKVEHSQENNFEKIDRAGELVGLV